MPKIVISYRRADSEAVTGRIRDRLVGHYGGDSIFMDIDNIPFGIDFRDYIKEALAETDAVIAVIGKRWTGATDSGPARIMDETDPVRIEVESALTRGVAVIPLLIDNAVMPQPIELPDGLKNLSFRNAAMVESGRDFHLHMDRLIRSMDRMLGRVEAQKAERTTADGSPGSQPPGGPRTPQYSPQQFSQPPFAQTPQITAMALPPKKSGKGKWIAIGAGAVALILAGVIAAALLYLPTSKDPLASAQPAAPPVLTAQPAPPPVVNPPVVAPPVVTPPVVAPPAPTPPVQTAGPAPKCKTETNVAFQDNFTSPALGWDDASASRYFADGQMVIQLKTTGFVSWLYRPLRFKNATVCAQVKAPLQAGKIGGLSSGGVVFWATDYSNYYLAQIYLDGSYHIYRRLSGEWIQVVGRTKSDKIRPGLGEVNELQVTVKDNTGTLYINGQSMVEFRGQPSDGGGSVGLYARSEPDRGSEWRFLDIAVVDQDAPAPKPASAKAIRAATTPIACKDDKDAAFADDFKKPDGGWGDLRDTAFYDDGNMLLKPAPHRARVLLYQSLRYASATVCANLKWPAEPLAQNETASGGIAFAASNYSNFYKASIFRDGSFSIYRMIADEWFAVAKRAKSDAIKTAPDAVNQVKVHVAGNKATLHINDSKIAETWIQSPARGGAVGLVAESDKERQNAWRFLDIMVLN
jgi:hypothetical protein